MIFAMLAQLLGVLLDLLTVCSRSATKDLEILVRRQQLRVLQRTQGHPPRPSRWEKLTLAVLDAELKGMAEGVRGPWRPSLVLFTPETVLRWHRDLVRRKWTFRHRPGPSWPIAAFSCVSWCSWDLLQFMTGPHLNCMGSSTR